MKLDIQKAYGNFLVTDNPHQDKKEDLSEEPQIILNISKVRDSFWK